jgi:tryptophan-rich sensory protein
MLRKSINAMALIGVLYVNYLANALPIHGKNTGELSDLYPNLFVPAGITFSIWGLIYLLLIFFVAAQFVRRQMSSVNAIGWLFVISCLLNVSWILAWHYERLVLSLMIMIGLLASLAGINRALVKSEDTLARVTFGIYLGWICIATIANTTALLVSIQWSGFGISAVAWTILLIAAGAGIGIWLTRKLDNPFLALPVAWAFLGILLKRLEDHPPVAYVAAAALAAVLSVTFFMSSRRGKVDQQPF